MSQWAVVFFANGSDQTMDEAVGPFRSRARALEAMEKLDQTIHEGAAPQLVNLIPLSAAPTEGASL